MLGLVFTELTAYLERNHSEEFLDRVLEDAAIAHDGAWTTVGNYPHGEALALIGAAAGALGEDPEALVRRFGQELFGRFRVRYPDFFADVDSALAFLERIEEHIHTEVRKLYTEARTPRLVAVREPSPTGDALYVEYASHRPMAVLAQGLIEGCIAHFSEDLVVERLDSSSDHRSARFHVRPSTD